MKYNDKSFENSFSNKFMKEKPIKCNICNSKLKLFFCKRTYEEKRPFRCEICDENMSL